MDTLASIVKDVREESGIATGCPICGSSAYNEAEGICGDCGINILEAVEKGQREFEAEAGMSDEERKEKAAKEYADWLLNILESRMVNLSDEEWEREGPALVKRHLEKEYEAWEAKQYAEDDRTNR